MITEKLENPFDKAQILTRHKFGTSDKAKINRKNYQEVLASLHLNGATSVTQTILKQHKEDPYKTVEEVIGDIQLILLQSWNDFKKVNSGFVISNLTLEDFLNDKVAL